MRQAIGATTTFKIAIVFTIIFASFLALAITYNKVFKIKNEMIGIIERYEGITENSKRIINNYISQNGYTTKSTCGSGYYGVSNLSTTSIEATNNSKEYYYCIKPIRIKNKLGVVDKVKYEVRVFFRFDIPLLGDLLTFNINGETKEIKLLNSGQLNS